MVFQLSIRRNISLFVGLLMFLVMIGAAAFAPYLTPYDPLQVNLSERLASMSLKHPLGTDALGRDLFARVIFGARYSLTIGVVSIAISMLMGGIGGIIGGFYSEGRVTQLLVWVTDILMAFPTIILGALMVITLGTGISSTIIVIAVAFFPRFFRLARASTMGTRGELYVKASRSLGSTDVHLLWAHVVPNVVSPLIVMSVVWCSVAISLEVALSFLGLGVPPPAPSWGTILADGLEYYQVSSLAVFAPCIAVAWAVQSLNMMGDRFRDILDPRTS